MCAVEKHIVDRLVDHGLHSSQVATAIKLDEFAVECTHMFSWKTAKEDSLVDLWHEGHCLYAICSSESADRMVKYAAMAEIAHYLSTTDLLLQFHLLLF